VQQAKTILIEKQSDFTSACGCHCTTRTPAFLRNISMANLPPLPALSLAKHRRVCVLFRASTFRGLRSYMVLVLPSGNQRPQHLTLVAIHCTGGGGRRLGTAAHHRTHVLPPRGSRGDAAQGDTRSAAAPLKAGKGRQAELNCAQTRKKPSAGRPAAAPEAQPPALIHAVQACAH